MSCEVLWSRANGDGGFEDLQTHVGPFSRGTEVHAPGRERIDEFSAGCFEGVGADEDRLRNFVCFEKLDCLKQIRCRS